MTPPLDRSTPAGVDSAPSPGPRTIRRREALRITAVAGVSLAMGGGLVASLLERGRLRRVSVTRTRLGTLVRISVLHPDAEAARAMVESAFTEIDRLEGVLSRYRADSALGRLNATGRLEAAPPELTHVLGSALAYAAKSGGAFDPTVAPLLALQSERFAADGSPALADDDPAVVAALALVDHRAVRLEGRRVTLERPGALLTLDGIAKGYVVDRAVAVLAGEGAGRVMVDAGGDIAVAGGSAGEPWRVGVQDPRSSGTLGVLRLRGESVASSGDYIQALTPDLSQHHIVDPRTGLSPQHTSAVTVVAPTAMDADALSTAAFVMGPREGLVLLEEAEGVEGLIVTRTQERLATSGFGRYRE